MMASAIASTALTARRAITTPPAIAKIALNIIALRELNKKELKELSLILFSLLLYMSEKI